MCVCMCVSVHMHVPRVCGEKNTRRSVQSGTHTTVLLSPLLPQFPLSGNGNGKATSLRPTYR